MAATGNEVPNLSQLMYLKEWIVDHVDTAIDEIRKAVEDITGTWEEAY